MRRAAVAVLVGGYAFGGIGSGLGHQPVIFGASLAAAVRPATKGVRLAAAFTPVSGARKAVPRHGMKTVEYRGYEISVPASWPVYFLNKDPNRCVRYDINAVYLGTPGTSQHCPPGLVGRTDTVSIGDQAAPPGQPA